MEPDAPFFHVSRANPMALSRIAVVSRDATRAQSRERCDEPLGFRQMAESDKVAESERFELSIRY